MTKSQIPAILHNAADTFEQRNAIYGSAYKRMGQLLLALFPESGIPVIKSADDAAKLAHIVLILTKLHRYAHAFEKGGHADSAHDIQVYAAMLEEVTKR